MYPSNLQKYWHSNPIFSVQDALVYPMASAKFGTPDSMMPR